MAITTQDQLVAAMASGQLALFQKTSRTAISALWFSTFDLVGNPGAGVLAGTSTAAGVVPTDATPGCPPQNNYGAGNVGYISAIDFGSAVASRHRLCDMLFKAGAYGFAAGTTTLAAQPSYSGRVPGGTDYKGTEIWIEVSTAFATGTAWQVQVTYTNQDGVAGKQSVISVAAAAASLTLGRMMQMAFATGDTGVQKIESVIVTNGGTAMTAGAFNVLVLRPLWTGRIRSINDGDTHGPDKTDLPQIFRTSALILQVASDATATGPLDMAVGIING